MKLKLIAILVFIFQTTFSFGQQVLSRQAALDSALKNHPQIVASFKNIEREKALKRGSVLIEKTDVWFESPTASFFALGLQQYFSVPSVYINQSKLQKEYIQLAQQELSINKNSVGKSAELIYLDLQLAREKLNLLYYQDSIYGKLFRSTEKRYTVGDAAYLEKVLEETKFLEIRNLMNQSIRDISTSEKQLLFLTGIHADSIVPERLEKYPSLSINQDTSLIRNNPLASYYLNNIRISERNFKLQRSLVLPNIFVGYLNQGYRNSENLYRLRFGVAVPLWLPTYVSRVKGARLGINVAQLQYQATINNLKIQYIKLYGDLQKNGSSLKYFEETALRQSEEIIRSSSILYSSGEISYFAYLQGLAQAMSIKMSYLDSIRNYNASLIELKYSIGQ